MDKSVLVKIVWLGAIAAIPTAIFVLQKPRATVKIDTHRVMTVERPVSVDVAQHVEAPMPAPPASATEVAVPAGPMRMVGTRITSKTAQAAPATSRGEEPRPPSGSAATQPVTAETVAPKREATLAAAATAPSAPLRAPE